jgi:hypothetical protein
LQNGFRQIFFPRQFVSVRGVRVEIQELEGECICACRTIKSAENSRG